MSKKKIIKVSSIKGTKKKTTVGISKKKVSRGKSEKSDKEKAVREANLIANSEKKKKTTRLKRPKTKLTPRQITGLAEAVIEGMKERKAKNILMLDLKKIENRVCDIFLICDADSKTHVASIAESVEETVLKLTGEKAWHSEGQENSEWILVDYVNVVAHIFLREVREHFNIEGLWGDAKFTPINN